MTDREIHAARMSPLRATFMGLLGAFIMIFLFSAALWTVWLTNPSEKFLNPLALTVEAVEGENGPTRWRATFVRETPFGDIYAEWITEARVVTDPDATVFECAVSGASWYQQEDNNTVQWWLSPKVTPCLEASGVRVFTQTHYVLWGPLRLKPVVRTYIVGTETLREPDVL